MDFAFAQVDSVLPANGRRPARPSGEYCRDRRDVNLEYGTTRYRRWFSATSTSSCASDGAGKFVRNVRSSDMLR